MAFIIRISLVVLVSLLMFISIILGDENGQFYLKASKSVPRIGRNNNQNNKNTNDENFEKFFLKASKSVPRIGRRGSPGSDLSSANPLLESRIKYPIYADIADLYEYNPELFSLPQLIQRIDETGEDFNNWDKISQRNIPIPTHINYKFQNDE